MIRILEKEQLAPAIGQMVLHAPHIARFARAGQFLIVLVHEFSERIPMTIADFDREAGTITIVYQEVGKSTRELGALQVGDAIAHVHGPLGRPSEIENFGTVVVMGGGVGVAPIFPITRELKAAGNHVVGITGARSIDILFWRERMRSVTHEIFEMTDDGSGGRKGFVTDALKDVLASRQVDRVIAIGPVPMMRAVAGVTRESGTPCVVSLNPIMVCGMGMCGGCRVKEGEKTRFTCYEGPEFDGNRVDFAELTERLRTYKLEEQEALARLISAHEEAANVR